MLRYIIIHLVVHSFVHSQSTGCYPLWYVFQNWDENESWIKMSFCLRDVFEDYCMGVAEGWEWFNGH